MLSLLLSAAVAHKDVISANAQDAVEGELVQLSAARCPADHGIT